MIRILSEVWRYALVAVAGYLLGGINSAIIVSNLVFHWDIRTKGSGNGGFTNAYRTMGPFWGVVVGVGDIIKGAVAVLIGTLLIQDVGALFGGLFAIVGHIYPIWFKFKGGKGVMTTAAVVFMIDWQVALVAAGVFLLIVIFTKYVSLGSMCASITMPITAALLHRTVTFVIITACLAAFIVFMHRTNIGRLAKGTESKFKLKPKKL